MTMSQLLSEYLDESGQFKKAVPATVAPIAADTAPPVDVLADPLVEHTTDEPQPGLLPESVTRAPRVAAAYATDRANRTVDWLATRSTPGGLAPLLIAIFVFLWAVVPVSNQGHTRMQLLFYTVMGRTGLKGQRDAAGTVGVPGQGTAAPNTGGGGSSWSDHSYAAPAGSDGNAGIDLSQYVHTFDFGSPS